MHALHTYTPKLESIVLTRVLQRVIEPMLRKCDSVTGGKILQCKSLDTLAAIFSSIFVTTTTGPSSSRLLVFITHSHHHQWHCCRFDSGVCQRLDHRQEWLQSHLNCCRHHALLRTSHFPHPLPFFF